MVELDALTLMEGAAFTVTVTFALALHPPRVVPETEYVVVTEGLTDILEEVAPVLHK